MTTETSLDKAGLETGMSTVPFSWSQLAVQPAENTFTFTFKIQYKVNLIWECYELRQFIPKSGLLCVV